MARGAIEFHDHVASRMQTALGRPLPQVEVRFENVSVSADIIVKDKTQVKTELPTIANVIKQSARQLGAKRHVVKKNILRNVSGVFKPGTMTLILGQPGSGKSSLMKLLSGRFPAGKNISIEGDVTFNGLSRGTLMKRLPQLVAYVPQNDKHLPTLTVKETLEFAHACNGGSLSARDEKHLVHGSPDENQAALDAARAMYKHHPDVIIRQLGLDKCQNTVVGDAMLRGVSGGERKRVTTGEMVFGNKFVLMMDEISTGLDSAATFDIISTQRSLAKAFNKTIVISLLQPSPEIFELFDEVVLLNDGYVMYHGPRSEALSYFEDKGFKCPPNRDVADFLMDLGTDKQRQYEIGPVPRYANQFADEFEKSDIHNRIVNDLHEPFKRELVEDNKTYIEHTPEFQQNFLTGTITLVARELKVLVQDSAAVKSRLFMALIIGLLYGTAFYQFDEVNSQVVMGLAYTAVDTLSVAKSSMIPTILATRDVIYKQRGANFYRTSSFVIASSAKQIPVVLMETLLFGSIVYWMCGFVASAQSYIFYILYQIVLFLVNMAYAAWFFFIASVCPNINVANPIALLSLLFLATFSGFLITKDSIPVYLSWVYWISPHAWGIHAVAVNQYRDSRFDTCVYNGVDYCAEYGMQMGEYMLSVYGVPTEKYWLWYGLVFLAAAYVFFMTLSCLVLEYWRYETPETISLDTESSDQDKNTASLRDNYALVATPKGASTKDEDHLVVSVTRSAERNFIPVTLAFKNLWYSVPDPTNSKATVDLLKNVSGFALPGTITALMGSSGAGKTTLMDVIAGRKTDGQIRGDIMLNGHPATDIAIRRATGYCEQMDIHSDSSTFREALTFSAFLRQGTDVSDSQKYDSVNECLDLLDLNPIADQIIRGSSTEQMKRLTIGVELAAQPSVLFLDEPTSGLDARSAKLIMDGVRKVADTGRTIVCTIHQPSAVVFAVFDSLLLLKRGGEMVFFGDLGEKASNLINYFESIDGVSKIEKDYNPATWMLEVIGAGVGNNSGGHTDFVELFKTSIQARELETNLNRDGITRPSSSAPALKFDKKRAASNVTQATFLIKRFFDMYWRTASYNLTRFLISIMLGLVFGIAYVGAEYSSYQGINSGLGMVFMTQSYMSFIVFSSVVPISIQERASFYRERSAQTYNAFWYFVGATLVEIPYCFVETLLFMIIYYPMVGFTGGVQFLSYWVNLTGLVILQAYFGQLLAYLAPNLEVASVFVILVNYVWITFTGFNPPVASIPRGYRWLYHLTPHKYTFASLTAIVFGECPNPDNGTQFGCRQMTGAPPTLGNGVTVAEYLDTIFSAKHSEIWTNFAIVLLWIVCLRAVSLLALRFVNHQKR
ncbi:ABC Superfamily [Phytophthora palmivora]|uniref:ABC Superfamily n=1 Tax=Phytophthora palmivora TaxID=4796 RepID=A0A2P4Y9C2_9STRA|nr:ABC Superfamily [Phytophthora palmivora]